MNLIFEIKQKIIEGKKIKIKKEHTINSSNLISVFLTQFVFQKLIFFALIY